MNCNVIREQLVDLADGSPAPADVGEHLRICPGCALKLEEMRKTMALLDEWRAPEPSPYFDVRLQARVREERRKASAGWMGWLRKPALGVLGTVLIIAAVGLFENGLSEHPVKQQPVVVSRGTPVGDLQFLDKNSDMLQDFDALDALDGSLDNSQETN